MAFKYIRVGCYGREVGQIDMWGCGHVDRQLLYCLDITVTCPLVNLSNCP